MTKNYSNPFGFAKAINVKSLDKLNKQQLDQLAKILKNVKW